MSKKQQSPAANYCFTWNNYAKEDEEKLAVFAKAHCRGLIYGREVAPKTGTPHLQGYFQLTKKMRITQLKKLLGDVAHFEVAKGSVEQNEKYCGKDKDIVTYGEFEKKGGSLNTIRAAINACKTWSDVLDIEGISKHMTYARECWSNRQPEKYEGIILREWQQELFDILMGPVEDRVLYWVHDSKGGKGKTFFAKYMMCNHGAFYSSPAKSQDIIYAYDNQRIFMYDIPFSADDSFLNWGMLEKIKDGIMFSGKYVPITKVRHEKCHVVIFSNHYCPQNVYVEGRVKLIDLDKERAKLLGPSECVEIISISTVKETANNAVPEDSEQVPKELASQPPHGGALALASGGLSTKKKPHRGRLEGEGALAPRPFGGEGPLTCADAKAQNIDIEELLNDTKELLNWHTINEELSDGDAEDARFDPFY